MIGKRTLPSRLINAFVFCNQEIMSHVVRKPAFCICETTKLISAFVFAIPIVQSLCCLHPQFQASSHLVWLNRPVCVGPSRKPRRPVFSQ